MTNPDALQNNRLVSLVAKSSTSDPPGWASHFGLERRRPSRMLEGWIPSRAPGKQFNYGKTKAPANVPCAGRRVSQLRTRYLF